jgi:hypothetical protein
LYYSVVGIGESFGMLESVWAGSILTEADALEALYTIEDGSTIGNVVSMIDSLRLGLGDGHTHDGEQGGDDLTHSHLVFFLRYRRQSRDLMKNSCQFLLNIYIQA